MFYLMLIVIVSFISYAQRYVHFYALMCLLGALFYMKVVTARVHVTFKYSFTSPYGDGIAILHGHPSHLVHREEFNPWKPHTHSARVLTIFGLELGTFHMLGQCTYQLSYASPCLHRIHLMLIIIMLLYNIEAVSRNIYIYISTSFFFPFYIYLSFNCVMTDLYILHTQANIFCSAAFEATFPHHKNYIIICNSIFVLQYESTGPWQTLHRNLNHWSCHFKYFNQHNMCVQFIENYTYLNIQIGYIFLDLKIQ